MALHQNDDPERAGWLDFQSINRHHGCECITYFALRWLLVRVRLSHRFSFASGSLAILLAIRRI
jgi:hypothetical protein